MNILSEFLSADADLLGSIMAMRAKGDAARSRQPDAERHVIRRWNAMQTNGSIGQTDWANP